MTTSNISFEPFPDRRELPLVLVVEDDAHAATVIAEAPRDERFVVATAANGRRALEMLDAGLRPNVVLVDRNMPVFDGAAFVTTVRGDPALATLPIVLMTTFGDSIDTALASNVQAVLHKPVRLNELVDVVERHRRRATSPIRLPR